MKTSRRNIITTFLLVASVTLFAQKQSKKYTETFNVNKNAKVEIEASNAEVEVTTWNKNQVYVEAIIEIDGLTKEEADKYLKNYKFEALGNKAKVKISARGNNSFRFNDNDFVVFNPENFAIPDIVLPAIEDIVIPSLENITIPEMNFEFPDMDWDNIFIDLDDIEFDFDKYYKDGKNYFFRWKDSVRDIKIKSKKDWEKFKKSKEYKELKADMKKKREKAKKEMAKVKEEYNSMDFQKLIKESLEVAKEAMEKVDMDKVVKESLDEARKALKEIDREEIKRDIEKAKKEFKKNFKSSYIFDTDSDELIINDKKVKIRKKIIVKVPKGVILDLNTRHCELKLPKMSASGKVSYGTFKAQGLEGGDLNIYYSPVNITTVNNTNLSLKNVTDANLVSVTNSSLTSDSSDLKIDQVFSGTNLESSFGDILIKKLNASIKDFKLVLNQSEARVNIGKLNNKLNILSAESINTNKKLSSLKVGDSYTLKGKFSLETNGGELKISGKYSELTFIK
ncbi:hypothetical protein AAON49_01470 [Pseudotenacibaculum sp. MALMAid0570]|uniref:hypothetical protein n=1 Tax=Pseudotenacibaculum sp. MALMAid0570 TaxID=3143938 RepID=UPI0032DFBD6E